ncbi:MAG TPA: hypothetical protein VM535_01725, partial [Candidatus Saccharimonadales bacterium]|nr:hypothetical protein [Candidatus Saccharimonadales bacterium]
MLDTVKQHFYEGFRLSTEVRDKIQERWGTVYGAADEAQRSLEREFGADLQPAEEAMQRPVDVVHLADNVINLEA